MHANERAECGYRVMDLVALDRQLRPGPAQVMVAHSLNPSYERLTPTPATSGAASGITRLRSEN